MRRLSLAVAVLALLTLSACSGASESTEGASATASSSSTSPAFPVAGDGSIITGGGYVFKGDFAICNKAKCAVPGADGTTQCTCDLLTDEWTLSPIPKNALDTLNSQGTTVSTFTTVNVTQARSVKCQVGQWADCYGALCTPNADGTATCTCPVSTENPVEWMKYVDSCTGPDVGCSADLQSVAPLFKVDPSLQDFTAAVKQAGDTIPGIPMACPVPSDSAS